MYLLGGHDAPPASLQADGNAVITGDSDIRVGGADRCATAAALTDATVRRSGDVGPIWLVTARDCADDVSMSADAQSSGGVILLTDGGGCPWRHRPTWRRTTPAGNVAWPSAAQRRPPQQMRGFSGPSSALSWGRPI